MPLLTQTDSVCCSYILKGEGLPHYKLCVRGGHYDDLEYRAEYKKLYLEMSSYSIGKDKVELTFVSIDLSKATHFTGPIRLSITMSGFGAPSGFANALASWYINSSDFFSALRGSRKVRPLSACLPTCPLHLCTIYVAPQMAVGREHSSNPSRNSRWQTCGYHS